VVVARVADGAMGRVYEGRHVQTKQRVAIKVLHDEVARDRIAVERFKREFETAQLLASSPYVVKVIDFGEAPEIAAGAGHSWFMTMEYLEGRELGALLRESGPVPPARALRMLCQVALGLDDAHSFGVIHRDLKPDNLFLCESPEGDVVRILDFGSVKLQMETGPKLTAFGTTLGSPYYMSPEQAMGKRDVDPRTDVFALGAILYETLSGKLAFEGETVAQILMKIVNEMPPPLSTVKSGLPLVLDDVLERALAKDKKQRFPSAIEFAGAVLTAFGLPVQPGRPGIEEWAAKPQAEIERALAAATPPAPAPFGATVTTSPAGPEGSPAHTTTSSPDRSPATDLSVASEGRPAPATTPVARPPSRASSVSLLVAVGLGAVLLVGIVGAAVFFLFQRS
jgi:serine/threonine-protein kinase